MFKTPVSNRQPGQAAAPAPAANRPGQRPANRVGPLVVKVGPKAQKAQKVEKSSLGAPRPVRQAAQLPAAARPLRAAAAPASASAASGSAASASAASARDASDALMHFVSMTAPGLSLPNEMWGEIAQFSSRKDVLSLRSASKGVSHWVDKSINTVTVAGKDAERMLKSLGKATNLKHIEALKITLLRAEDYPSVVAALSKLPLGKMTLTISSDEESGLSQVGLLHTLSPLSLSLNLSYAPTEEEAAILSTFPYPINVWMDDDQTQSEDEILTLSTISNMASLRVVVNGFSDNAANVFVGHSALRNLDIVSFSSRSISNSAIASLAGNPALQRLRIVDDHHVFDEAVLTALAGNRHLKILILCDSCNDTTLGMDAAAIKILSQNKTLTELQVSVADGVRYLAKMPSLQRLTLVEPVKNKISLEDATEFSKHAHLKAIFLVAGVLSQHANGGFQAGALAKLLSSNIESIGLSRVHLTPPDVAALLANKAVRHLRHEYADASYIPDQKQYVPFSPVDFANTFALAMHPTLEKFDVCYDEDMRSNLDFVVTKEQRAMLSVAWVSAQRPASTFSIDI